MHAVKKLKNGRVKKSWTDCKSFLSGGSLVLDREYYIVLQDRAAEAFEWLRRIQTWLRPDDNGIQALVKSQWHLIQWPKWPKRERVTRPQLPEWPLSQSVDLQWQLTLFEASFRSSPNEGIQRWKRVERKKGDKRISGEKNAPKKIGSMWKTKVFGISWEENLTEPEDSRLFLQVPIYAIFIAMHSRWSKDVSARRK